VRPEHKSVFMDKPLTGILTLGYDPQKKKYVATWMDSVSSYLWKYEATMDLDRQDRRKVSDDGIPRVATVGRCVNLPAGGSEIHAARFQRVQRPWRRAAR